jgi:hypothetical protein
VDAIWVYAAYPLISNACTRYNCTVHHDTREMGNTMIKW